MNRTALAVFSVLGLATMLSADPPAAPIKFSSKHMEITGLSPLGLSYVIATGVFHAKGDPLLHAVMPLKHMTLNAARIDGHIDTTIGAFKDATLAGGVSGTLDNKAKVGTNRITFSGSTAVYTDKGTESEPAADIDVTGGVKFQSTNGTVGSKFSLSGSHGAFHLSTPANQEMSLQNADLDGPVSFSFSGVPTGTGKKQEASSGSGTAGHLMITRNGGDYVLQLSGGISLEGNAFGFNGSFPSMGSATITIDESGNFKTFSTPESVAGTLTPHKQS
jgi:hypothetical protein